MLCAAVGPIAEVLVEGAARRLEALLQPAIDAHARPLDLVDHDLVAVDDVPFPLAARAQLAPVYAELMPYNSPRIRCVSAHICSIDTRHTPSVLSEIHRHIYDFTSMIRESALGGSEQQSALISCSQSSQRLALDAVPTSWHQ